MRTAFLMTALTVLLVLVGDYFGGARGMMMMLIISLAMNLFSYWNSDKLVLAQYNAKQVDEKSAPALYKMVQRLAERGNLPMPKVYIIDSPVPNAFATGRNPEHAAVAVTTDLANALDKDEIEGVLAHELSHVKHGDILIGTIAASMAGIITTLSHWGMFFGGGDRDRNSSSSAIVGLAMMILAPLAAGIIQMAVSRSREYMADKSGGELSGNPDALADALLKIESYAKNTRLWTSLEFIRPLRRPWRKLLPMKQRLIRQLTIQKVTPQKLMLQKPDLLRSRRKRIPTPPTR